MTYGIIGTGAIGGYYGAKLALTGKDVHFLLHSDYGHVKEHGLQTDQAAFAAETIRRIHANGNFDSVLLGRGEGV